MNLEKTYKDVLKYYPSYIDISDGNIVLANGFNSTNLFTAYEEADNVASLSGDEWQSLITWIFYQVMHDEAKIQFVKKDYILKKEINKGNFRRYLIENLKAEGYNDMYNEFLDYEKEKGIFI